jgi:hypothetical protein
MRPYTEEEKLRRDDTFSEGIQAYQDAARDYVIAKIRPAPGLTTWNDRGGRTKQEVIEALTYKE